MPKLKTSTLDLLEQCREAIAEEHGVRGGREWDPLVEMAVAANDPALNRAVRAGLNKELAQYFYPKLKSIEHTGEGAARPIQLVHFSKDGSTVVYGQLAMGESAPIESLPAPADPE